MTERFANQLVMILDGGIDATQSSLAVLDPTGCPASGDFRLAVGPPTGPWELVIATARSGSTITVTRHAEGTTATTHGDGEEVRLVLTAAVLADLVAAKLPPGGATGYVLRKQSGADFDTAWSISGATGATGLAGPVSRVQTFWHDDAVVITGNPLAVTVATDQRHNYYARQDAPANGDVFQHEILLAAGTYSIKWIGVASAASGKIDWSLDGGAAFETAQDWYNASTTPETVKTITAPLVTVLTGAHLLKGTVNGKNGASAGFAIQLTRIVVTKVA